MQKAHIPSPPLGRRLAGALVAFLLLGALTGGVAGADTKADLDAAKARLAELEAQIEAENSQLNALEVELNDLATKIDAATSEYQTTQQAVMATRQLLDQARERYQTLRAQLDDRAASAYMEGPGTGLEVVLGAATLADFTDRLEFLDSVSQHDTDLANQVQNLANELHGREVELEKVLHQQAQVINVLNVERSELDAKFEQVQSIRHDLTTKQNEVVTLVAKLKKKIAEEERQRLLALARSSGGAVIKGPGPFKVCPVDEPRAFGDSFGAPRYAGGYHPHAGNDIMAPRGTPIRAPFDGYAEPHPNGLGGNAVVVEGAEGYVYNAHLDSYGTMGNVVAGTIIGYVGDSGDALGGPTHDHFEWHPDVIPANPYESSYGYTTIGDAIDPYPYLLMVC